MHLVQPEYDANSPIGIFDSGVGGLSILRHIHALLPHEALLYFADSGFAPYGEKPEAVIVERALSIADFLLQQNCKAIVVACNTATAARSNRSRSSPTRKPHPHAKTRAPEPPSESLPSSAPCPCCNCSSARLK